MRCMISVGLLFLFLLALPFSAPGREIGDSVALSPVSGIHTFSGGDELDPAPIFGLRASYEVVGQDLSDSITVEGGLGFVQAKTDAGDDADVLLVNLEAIYPLLPRKRASPYLAIGTGGRYVDGPADSSFNPLLDYGLGVRYFFQDFVAGRLDFRHMVVFDTTRRNNYEILFGLSFFVKDDGIVRVPVVDSDRDGVPDRKDRCPDTPRGTKVDSAGCPEDADGDGVPDQRDRCLNTPRGTKVNKEGCPDEPKPLEAKPEGTVEVRPGGASRSPSYGVGDGVSLSKAPDRAPLPVAPPVSPSKSAGSVAMPAESLEPGALQPLPVLLPERGAPPEDLLACPDGPVLQFRETASLLEYSARFPLNSARVRRQDREVARKIALFLKYNPAVTVLIEGHADKTGKSGYNLRLSRERAEALQRDLLSRYDINPGRVKIVGYGCASPIADNKTREGRGENRRSVAIIRLDSR